MSLQLENHRHIHFVGIAGIGMSALARLLASRGYHVSGSDHAPAEQGPALARMGIAVAAGHDARNVEHADLVVVSSAVDSANPELQAARQHAVPIIKRSELLGAIMRRGQGIAVAGTHGKTTTTALIGWILVEAGGDPTILVGGMMNNLTSNARQGAGAFVVAEADEYDGSFLQLSPAIAVLTNVEPEHLDFYGTPDNLFTAFREFVSSVSENMVVCADDAGAMRVVKDAQIPIHEYGIERGQTRATDISDHNGMLRFAVPDDTGGSVFEMQLAGRHNVRNALAAIVTARQVGVPEATIQSALRTFRGTARRTEVKGEVNGVLVIDDYAHHPTEIVATLGAVKQRYHRPILVMFQPHTYSRTRAFLEEFAGAFKDADAVYVLDIYAAREKDTLGMSGRGLAEKMSGEHPDVSYEDAWGAVDRVVGRAKTGDVIVTMGAGDVYLLGRQILEELARQ